MDRIAVPDTCADASDVWLSDLLPCTFPRCWWTEVHEHSRLRYLILIHHIRARTVHLRGVLGTLYSFLRFSELSDCEAMPLAEAQRGKAKGAQPAATRKCQGQYREVEEEGGAREGKAEVDAPEQPTEARRGQHIGPHHLLMARHNSGLRGDLKESMQCQ